MRTIHYFIDVATSHLIRSAVSGSVQPFSSPYRRPYIPLYTPSLICTVLLFALRISFVQA